jgi:uncharacterized protein (DUF2384 family)
MNTPDHPDAIRAIALRELLTRAQAIVANSTSPDAVGFDTTEWLKRWIETPQPALGGRTPSEFLDKREGAEAVFRLLGAIESGSYQ